MLKIITGLDVHESSFSWKLTFNLFDGETPVGEAEAYVIQGGEELAAYLDQADIYSPWVPYDAMVSIDYDHTAEHMAHNIGYLHMMQIFEEHRGNKYATYFLRAIENRMKTQGTQTMILQPYPLERDNPSFYFSHIESLVAFYERSGYTFFETMEPKTTPYYSKTII